MTIRYIELGRADTASIVRVQFESWSRSYTHVLSADYIAGPLRGDIEKNWSRWADNKTVVGAVTEDGRLIGFATYLIAPSTYIDNFHVDLSYHGRGVAQGMFQEGLKSVVDSGAETLWLTVLEKNARARAFYAKMGGQEGAVKTEKMLGTPVEAVPVYWEDLHSVQKI